MNYFPVPSFKLTMWAWSEPMYAWLALNMGPSGRVDVRVHVFAEQCHCLEICALFSIKLMSAASRKKYR